MDERKNYAVGQLLEIAQLINKKGLEHQNEDARTAYYESVEIILKQINELNEGNKNE